jgi:DNA-binding NtrC family response regulator
MRILEKNSYDRSAAAREMGIDKSTLFRKIKRLGLTLPERDGRTARAGKGRRNFGTD